MNGIYLLYSQSFAKISQQGGIKWNFIAEAGIPEKILHIAVLRNLIYGLPIIQFA